jgi:hypothetical protein
VVGGAFAGEDDFGVGGGELEEGGIAESIIGDDLGTGEQFGAAHGEQADIAGTGAD